MEETKGGCDYNCDGGRGVELLWGGGKCRPVGMEVYMGCLLGCEPHIYF